MKVIYEFKDPEEKNERQLFEISGDMFSALWDMQNYLRELKKGWKEDDKEKIIDTIEDLLYNSKICEIE